MATTVYGYKKVRELLQGAITHIEIRNASNARVVRIPVNDSRVSVYDDATVSPLGYQVILTASDADMGVGKTVAGFAFYDVATGGSALVEDTFPTSVTFNNAADKATLKMNIATPL